MRNWTPTNSFVTSPFSLTRSYGLNREPIANVVRIRKIVNANTFRLDRVPAHEQSSENGSALFVSASYFNHSCIPNAIWTTYNDVVVFHVFKPVTCVEQVTVAYERESPELFSTKKNTTSVGVGCNGCNGDDGIGQLWR
ncbi:hypothetical protein BV898_17627 [Hypsibius exemplaris]|uniref:SET domain-containing protein n=1 Tax=Hypsibius exemplaris TaxID=2072580 RepID=A0A9X6RM88_HYPEX|nr:hypothetical protein BV898_17627 [Hypsibius exemplaris]